MWRILKALGRFILVGLPMLVLIGAALVVWMSRSVPPASGAMAIAGLGGSVTIHRDAEGVPHIAGATRADVFAGLGFAHAQDRLWQMEIGRMAGQGRLSEIFGSTTLDTDIWLRTMGFHRAAHAAMDALEPDERAAFEAYARGVNAWLDRDGTWFAADYPPEFYVLRHRPEPWTAVDVVVAIKMMSVGLAANLNEEISRLAFSRLGMSAAEIDELLPPHRSDTPPPLPDLAALLDLDSGPIPPAGETAGLSLDFTPADGLAAGASNNWVVSGSRTQSGLPLLANDPHLGLTTPSIWYLAHLRVEGEFGAPRNLVGATLPGTPFVLLGRSDALAWGFTTTGADVQDIFIEKVNPDNGDEYLTPDGWRPFESRQETIGVQGGEAVTITVRHTRHGPVLPRDFGGLGRYLPRDTVAALGWVALAEDDTTAAVGYDLWTFRTVADYQNGMRRYVTPMQSMVVADTQGSIGLIAAGRVPVRAPDNAVMGRAPVPGWQARYDWQGYMPFEALPRVTNPAGGALGTANTRIVAPDHPHFLTFDWQEPFRQARLEDLIFEADRPHTLASFRAAQADVTSLAFRAVMPTMIAAVDGRDDVDGALLERLAAWDGTMGGARSEPLVAMAWMREAMQRIYRDDLGPAFQRWFRLRPEALMAALAAEPARAWCDNRSTDGVEPCPLVLAEALNAALADLEYRFGEDRGDWRWGRVHQAVGEHRPFGRLPPLDRIFNVTVDTPGGPFTLNRGGTPIGDGDNPFINVHAASYRGLFDLADLDRSTFIHSTGQSGNVFSRHYSDYARRWANVDALTIATDPEDYEPAAVGVWRLSPLP